MWFSTQIVLFHCGVYNLSKLKVYISQVYETKQNKRRRILSQRNMRLSASVNSSILIVVFVLQCVLITKAKVCRAIAVLYNMEFL